MFLYLLVLALVVVLVCIVIYTSIPKAEGFTVEQVKFLGAEPTLATGAENLSSLIARIDGNVTALVPFGTTTSAASSFSTLSYYQNPLSGKSWSPSTTTTLQKVSTILLPLRELRTRLSWYFPLSFSGGEVTLSPAVAAYYAKTFGVTRKAVTFKTANNVLGDIYPLSIRDDGGTINPYDSQTGMLSETGVENSYQAETVEYSGFPQVATRVEINKASPVTLTQGLTISGSMKRIFSNPNVGSSCITGLADDDNYVPSRLKPDFALLTPFLSPNNLAFGSSPAEYSSTAPSYANKSGATGAGLPAAEYYYSENGVTKSRTSWLTSQSFALPPGANNIVANLNLNPYVPVRKTGGATTQVALSSSTADRKKWYEKTFRGRVRCSVQARLSSVTGAIAYLFDSAGNMVFAEPLRAFNFPQAATTAAVPLESLYFTKGASATAMAEAEAKIVEEREKVIASLYKDIDNDYYSKQDRIAKAKEAIDNSYRASENAYNNMVAESNRNIENTRVATRNGIANQTKDSKAKIDSEWNKVSGDITRMKQEIIDRQGKCDAAVQAKVNDLDKAIAAGKKQSEIDNLRKKVEEQRAHEAEVCGKWIGDHNRKMSEKMANYNKVKAEEEAKIAKKTQEEDKKLADKISEEKEKQAKKRAYETKVHSERTAHEEKIIADEKSKHAELRAKKKAEIEVRRAEFNEKIEKEKSKFQEKGKYPPELMANASVAVLNQSFPVLAPYSLFEKEVLTLDSLTAMPDSAAPKVPELVPGVSGPLIGAVRSINNVYFDLDKDATSLREGITGATAGFLTSGKLPLGGFEFLSPYNSPGELLGSSFTDQTKRTFVLSEASLRYGSHGAFPKAAKPGYNDYILNQYTHNYYFPWIGSKMTKYIVIENCTANTKNLIALGLFLRKYSTPVMDPLYTEPIPVEDIFCCYPTTSVSSQYTLAGTGSGIPLARLVDPSRSFPKGREFLTDDNSLAAGTYPLIGAPHFSHEQGWWKKAGGQDNYLLPESGNSQWASTTALTSGRVGTASKTIIIVLRKPVLLCSLNYISRTVPRVGNDEYEKIATTGFNLTDKDVTFRNCNYVTLYNNNTQCISSCTINDSFVDSTGGSGTVSMSIAGPVASSPGGFATNLLSVATFGPTTMLETAGGYIVTP